MVVVGLVFAAIAALIHVYIFYMESLAWGSPAAKSVFGTPDQDVAVTKPFAYNQGFYNLFLAIEIAVGIVAVVMGHKGVGSALVFAGAGSMVLAGLVLYVSDPGKRPAALKQLVPPLVGVLALALGLAL